MDWHEPIHPQIVVLANGVFDILHVGHVRYLEAAAQMGDKLIVSVTRDKFVNKGDGRPIYNEQERLEVVQALRCVRSVVLVDGALDALERVGPDIFVKGREYENRIEKIHEDYCKAHGIEIRFTDTETVRPRDRLRQG